MDELKEQYFGFVKKGLLAFAVSVANFWIVIKYLEFINAGNVIFYITNYAMIYYFIRTILHMIKIKRFERELKT